MIPREIDSGAQAISLAGDQDHFGQHRRVFFLRRFFIAILASKRFRTILWIAWIGYAIVLFLATHLPVPEDFVEVVSSFDKLLHASAYFVLCVLTILALNRGATLRAPSCLLLIGLLAYAGLDEYLQGFVNRFPDLADWASDAVGIFLGFLLLRSFATRK